MRRLVAPLGAVLLTAALAGVPSASSAADPAPGPSPAGAAGTPDGSAEERAPRLKTVVRKYGDGPVRMDRKGQPIDIRFRGSKGDRVLLTQARPGSAVMLLPAKVEGPRGKVPRSHGLWWRLRTDGWHTIHYAGGSGARISLQLTTVKLVDVERDAPATNLPVRRGRIWAAGFEVPETGLLSGTVLGKGSQLLVRPDKQAAFRLARYSVVLGDDMPVVTGSPFGYPRSRAQHAGDVIRVLTAGGLASAVTPARVTGTLDGPAVAADAQRAHAVEIVIDGAEGQWFTARSPMVDTGAHVTVLQGPDGRLVDPSPRRDLWQLTATGQSRLLLLPTKGTESSPLLLSSVASGPALTPDAPPVTISADPAGRGTIMAVQPTSTYGRKLAATNSTLAPDWYVVLLKAHVPHYDRQCLGCGEGDYVGADAKNPVSQFGNGAWVYLPPGFGQGTIDLQVKTS